MRLLIFVICIISSLTSLGQITYMPRVEKQDQDFVWIKRVEINEIYTKINFFFQPPGEAWICLDRSFHLQPSGMENKIFMLASENIPFCPKMKKVGTVRDHLEFYAIFPKLQEGIEKFDLYEKKRNGLNFYGVQINNGGQPPLPDTLDLRKEQDFTRFFTKVDHARDSLEGIWTLIMTSMLNSKGKPINRQFKEDQLSVAFIKSGDSYKVYKTNGAPCELTFRPGANGRNMFFKKYFRKIDQEVTGYAKDFTSDFFEIKIELPKRLSHYELIPDYLPGDGIVRVYKFYNKLTFPEVPKIK